MNELIQASFSPATLPATILLIFVIGYWLLFLIGFLDLEFLDLDLDLDAEVELDVDVDMDVDVDVDAEVDAGVSGGGPSGLKGLLSALNIGHVPMMVWLSVFALFFWYGSYLITHNFSQEGTWVIVGMISGVFLVTIGITKLFTWPLKKVFRSLNLEAKPLRALGKFAEVTISAGPDRMGQAKYLRNDDPILLKIYTIDDREVKPGDKVLIREHDKTQNIYKVEPFNITTA